MKSRSMISALSSIYYLCSIKCMMEGIGNSTDQLYFSYNKKDFSDFDFNITDEILSTDFLLQPPFGYNTPLGNFLDAFCLFYQFSKVKHDANLEQVFKNFFVCGNKKKCSCQCDFAEISFGKFLSQQYRIINKILNENDPLKKLVIVEEKDGRVFCRLNPEIELDHDHDEEENFDEMFNDGKIRILKNKFFVKFNEMYLQDDLHLNCLSLLNELCDIYVANNYGDEHPYIQLFNILFKIDNLYRGNILNLTGKNERIYRKFCTEDIISTFINYIDAVIERDYKGELTKYSEKLLAKTTAKILLNVSNNLDIIHKSCEYIKSVVLLKHEIKEFFNKKNLNEKSIMTLQMICLEWDILIRNK